MLNQTYRQSQDQSLRPLTTAHLAQTMTLLQLSSLELKQKVEAEISSNPAIEVTDFSTCPSCNRPLSGNNPCPICNGNIDNLEDAPIIFVSPRSDFIVPGKVTHEEESSPEERIAATEDLHSYVLRQVAPDLNPIDLPIARHILTSLDDDGLLNIPIVEVAQYHHVPISRVEKVIEQIQHTDPVGVGSSSPIDALLVQLDLLSETQHVPPLAQRAIQEGMDLLSRHSYVELGRLLGASSVDAAEISRFISENLNPYPARTHWGNIRDGNPSPHEIQSPDVIITVLDHPTHKLVVEVVSPYAGRLRINPLFREAIKEAPSEKSKKWQEDMEQANLLIKCIQQRNHTIVRLMRLIVDIQRQFILKGDIHLIPITRASLAEILQVHESTVSRAVSSKIVQLPNRRLIPLSKMFDRSLHIRAEIKQIISEETKPFNDIQIANILLERGFSVARRTVAKYRSIEGILPARMRQSSAPQTPA
jgi:RNA polymerase sigma-54 factor